MTGRIAPKTKVDPARMGRNSQLRSGLAARRVKRTDGTGRQGCNPQTRPAASAAWPCRVPGRCGLPGKKRCKYDRRTLERWRQWWLTTFVQSSFWKGARARFMPPLCQRTLPASLCLSFLVEVRHPLRPFPRQSSCTHDGNSGLGGVHFVPPVAIGFDGQFIRDLTQTRTQT
jgi:hypothetical protein